MKANEQDAQLADVQKQEQEQQKEQKNSHDSSFDKLNRSRYSFNEDSPPQSQHSSQRLQKKKTNQTRVISIPSSMKEKVEQINKLSCMARFADSIRIVTPIPSVILLTNAFVSSGLYAVLYQQDSQFKALKYYNRLLYPIRFSTTLNLILVLLYYAIMVDMIYASKELFVKICSIILFDFYILGLLLHGVFFFIVRQVDFNELTLNKRFQGSYNIILANMIVYCVVFCGLLVGAIVFVAIGGRLKSKKIYGLIRVVSMREEDQQFRQQQQQKQQQQQQLRDQIKHNKNEQKNNSISQIREMKFENFDQFGKEKIDGSIMQTTIHNIESVPRLKNSLAKINPDDEAEL